MATTTHPETVAEALKAPWAAGALVLCAVLAAKERRWRERAVIRRVIEAKRKEFTASSARLRECVSEGKRQEAEEEMKRQERIVEEVKALARKYERGK